MDRRWHRIARVVVVVLATTLLVDATVSADEIIVLHSRPGVTESPVVAAKRA